MFACSSERQRNVVLSLSTLLRSSRPNTLQPTWTDWSKGKWKTRKSCPCSRLPPSWNSGPVDSRVNGCEQTLLIHKRSQLHLHEVQPAQQNRRLCHHLQSPNPPPPQTLPLLQVQGRTSKGENERGHSFLGPIAKTYQGCASARNQPGLLDTLKWQSRLETGGEDQTWGEKQRQIRWTDATERNSRQIRVGTATFMQVTSHIPFHLFLTTKGERERKKACEILMTRRSLEVPH